jgi:predicted Zn finger-like uncharacterized protein
MRATCPHCQRGFAVPDEKVPAGKEVVVICPGCKGKFPLSRSVQPPPGDPGREAIPRPSGAGSRAKHGSGGLCCVVDGALRNRIVAVLEKAGHAMVCPASSEQGVEMLRFTSLPLVVYEEGFDRAPGTGVWGWLGSQSGEDRRRIFVVWLGKGVPSEDPMFALSRSADLVLEERDVEDLPAYLMEAEEERNRFYAPLRSVLKELGIETLLPV